jgi:hypothetical protein
LTPCFPAHGITGVTWTAVSTDQACATTDNRDGMAVSRGKNQTGLPNQLFLSRSGRGGGPGTDGQAESEAGSRALPCSMLRRQAPEYRCQICLYIQCITGDS